MDPFTAALSQLESDTSKLDTVRSLALQLMAEHGLTAKGWTFQWDNARERAAQCRPAKKVISLSAPLAKLWPMRENRDSILHEIAHALTPGDHWHGQQWRAMCRRIGAVPARRAPVELPAPPKRWVGTCAAGHRNYQNRLPRDKQGRQRQYSCSVCHRGAFDERYLLTWERNTEQETAP
jgi:hypothetical protein